MVFENFHTKINKVNVQIKSLKTKLKLQQQSSRRLKTRVKSLENVIKTLKRKDLISSNCEAMLKQHFEGLPLALFTRKRSTLKKEKYSKELKSFALTLQFYSSKAYGYVRKMFNLALPHPSTVRRWYTAVPAEPGFTELAFRPIKCAVEMSTQETVCALMLDEMAIRRHVAWDGEKYRGFVDLGCGVDDDDSSPVAKYALVIMAVCINKSWKVPLGCFFIDGLTGQGRANLVRIAIERLSQVGAKVVSLTCDGPQWWILGEANEAVASGPPFFGGPSSKTAYTVLDSLQMFAQRTIRSEDLFLFFFRERLDFGRKIGKSEMKSK